MSAVVPVATPVSTPYPAPALPLPGTSPLRSWSTRAALISRVLGGAALGRIYKLNFDTTTHCNSRCLTCNVWKYYDEHPEDAARELKSDEIAKIFARLPDSITWLSLTGGEPFLREDFGETLKSAVEHIRGLKLIGIPSNGLTCDRMMRMLEPVLSKPHPLIILSISLDGPEATHDRVRGVPGGFARSWATYERIREWTKADRNFHICVETTISRLNVDEVEPFLTGLVDGGHDVTITVGHEGALYHSIKREEVSPEAQADKVARIAEAVMSRKAVRNPKDMVGRAYLRRVPGYLRARDRMVVPCASLQASATINHFGEVVPCLMWARNLGDIRAHDYRLQSVLDTAATKEARAQIQAEKCPNCWTPCEAYQSLISRVVRLGR